MWGSFYELLLLNGTKQYCDIAFWDNILSYSGGFIRGIIAGIYFIVLIPDLGGLCPFLRSHAKGTVTFSVRCVDVRI